MKNICLYQLMAHGRSKRGPDIFFPMFFKHYVCDKPRTFRLWYFIKTDNRKEVLEDFVASGIPTDDVVFLDIHHGRFKFVKDNVQLLTKILRYRINILHLLTYISEIEHLHFLKFMQRLPQVVKPKLAFTITYNGIPTAFEENYDPRFEKDRKKYGNLFSQVKFDGLLTWYDSFRNFTKTNSMFAYQPEVCCIESRFCDHERYFPAPKEQIITWASALVNYKGPLMFLEGIQILKQRSPKLLSGWKIVLAGYGPMQVEVEEYMLTHGLVECSMMTDLSDISGLLNRSMCYVSTQEIDNFPSLAMNEAMASGNVIIARNVGRTFLFVEEGKNGFLAIEDTPSGIAECLGKFLSETTNREAMMRHSVELTRTKHTPENFILQVEAFWKRLMLARNV